MIALQEICESIFSKNFEKIGVFCQDSSGVGSVQRLHDCLQRIAEYSKKISKFLTIVNLEEFDLVDDIIDKLKEEFSEDFEEDSIFGISDFEHGDLEDDLNNLPLYSLDDRVRVEIMENQDIDNVIQSINSVIKNEIYGSRRAVEVVLSGMRVFGGQHPELAIRMLNELGLDDKSDEKIKDMLQEPLKNWENWTKPVEFFEIASNLLQTSLLDRIEVLSNWIENGYDLDFVDYSTDEIIPVHGRLMYCVHSSLPFVTSGYTIRTENVVKSLEKRGFEVSVFTRWGFPTDRKDYEGENIDSCSIEIDSISHHYDPDSNGIGVHRNEDYILKATASLLDRAREFRPSLIYSASDHTIGLAASIVAENLSIPFVYEMRGIWAYSRAANNVGFEGSSQYKLLLALEKQCALRADRLFVISEGLKEIAIDWGVEPRKICLIPNGVQQGQVTGDKQGGFSYDNNSRINIGYVGSVVPYEGLEILVEAAKILKAKHGKMSPRFTIAGDGSSMTDLREEIAISRLSNDFEILGKVPHSEISGIYRTIDVVVVPRLSREVTEVIPALKPLEAMLYGKLVVCSDVGPSSELIR